MRAHRLWQPFPPTRADARPTQECVSQFNLATPRGRGRSRGDGDGGGGRNLRGSSGESLRVLCDRTASAVARPTVTAETSFDVPTCVPLPVGPFLSVCVCVCVCVCIHTYIHAYIHTYKLILSFVGS